MKNRIKTLSILCLMACLLLINPVYSQEIKPLTVGDTMPDVILKSVLNYSKRSAQLSDFAGKAMILDFWFIRCGSCRAAMPHLDSLQKAFKNDLQLLLVTWEDKKKVEEFFTTDLDAKHLKFVNVVNDSLLRKIFPARGFPHQVWIDKNNRITAITDGTNTSVENIQKLISAKKIDLPVKVDEMDSKLHQGTDPLMTYRYGTTKDKILKYSYLSKRRLEFRGGSSLEVDTLNQIARASFTNIDFLQLYDNAYTSSLGSGDLHRPSRLIRKDTSSVKTEADYKTFTNVFCYDLMYKDTTTRGFGKYMIRDLDEYFGLKSRLETKKIKCLVIKEKGVGKGYRQPLNGNDKRFLDCKMIVGKKNKANKAWQGFVLEELNRNSYMPIIIDLDINQPISFEFTWTPNDIKAMSKELEKFGLEMVVEKRPRKVIILENN
ncbi:TlpA family protein disulfide reductase [Chryseobacterium herbae]|uniref:TlpA family protein disulfide reductase n=1 Tax=Chryseobacterium herbae TaxID=2976476 RepID=A0ABT2ITL1_9FLAO|nr:TlpA family protein disulfide reductase [Chryseobacterium sp. pc1-10]MCT2561836.1 TlpA family protein disulfide reductase [Chryseobacterium sp. pc1-10]